MNIDYIASRLSETDAAEFRAADHAWKWACERVGKLREQELRHLVQNFKREATGSLTDYLQPFGYDVSVVEDGVYRVWDDATCLSFQVTGLGGHEEK